MSIGNDIIELLEKSGKNWIGFDNLVIKNHPHSPGVPIHNIYKDWEDNEWTVCYGRNPVLLVVKEITNTETLATIYQRLKIMLSESQTTNK